VVDLLFAPACSEREVTPPSASQPSAQPTPIQAAPLASAPASAAATRVEEASFVVAAFKGEYLRDCVDANVRIRRQRTSSAVPDAPSRAAVSTKGLSAEQLALVVADEGLLWEGKTILADNGREEFTSMLANLINAQWLKSDDVETRKGAMKFVDGVAKAKWGVTHRAEEVKRGEMAKVETCRFPGHTPLGTCTIDGSWEGDGYDGVSWRIDRYHFDVASTVDSDSAMKACLKVGGKWKAADVSDLGVARERMHQHTAKLRDLVGNH
jgi:hypothetical protein